jgi:hypothetical protein
MPRPQSARVRTATIFMGGFAAGCLFMNGVVALAHADTPFTCQSFDSNHKTSNIYCRDQEGHQQHIFCYQTQFGQTCNSN